MVLGDGARGFNCNYVSGKDAQTMPLLNRDQKIYYVNREIWREAYRLAEERRDAPVIVYYWWLGGDLDAASAAELRLWREPLHQDRKFDFTPQERHLKSVGRGPGLPDPLVPRIEYDLPWKD